MNSHQEWEDHKNWIVEQLIACEMNTLTDKQRTLFLEMVEENKKHDLFIDAFKTFQEMKTFMKYKKLKENF